MDRLVDLLFSKLGIWLEIVAELAEFIFEEGLLILIVNQAFT